MRLWRRRRRVYVDDLPKTHDVRFATLFLLGLLGLFGALYVVGYFAAGERLPAGTTVAGIHVGGMNRDKARAELEEKLAPRLERQLRLVTPRHTFPIHPQPAGLVFDIEATLDKSLGSGDRWDPRHMLQVFIGGDTVQPVIDVDADELDATLDKLAGRVEQRPQESSVTFGRQQPEIHYGRTGRVIDTILTRDRLVDALVHDDTRVRLAVMTVEPQVTPTEASDFARGPGADAMSGPVTLHVDGDDVRLRAGQFGPALRAVVRGGGLALDVDSDQLYARAIEEFSDAVEPPTDARVVIDEGSPVVVPSQAGREVAREEWARALLAAVRRPAGEREALVDTQRVLPIFTTAQAKSLRITTRLAEATVTVPDTVDSQMLVDAAGQLDGSLVTSGGMLSFAGSVDGSVRPPAVSWVAAAAYDATFSAGLDIVERTPWRTYDEALEPGRDARVRPPDDDLVVRNPTRNGVLLVARAEPSSGGSTTVTVEVWGSSPWQVTTSTSPRTDVVRPEARQSFAEPCEPRAGTPGFDVDVQRVFARDGVAVRTETVHTHYEPLDRLVCS